MRSLNVAIRQQLDLYACVRPIRHFPGVSTPMKDSSQVEMVIFRENTEDIYAGIEWPAGSPDAQKLIVFLHRELGVTGAWKRICSASFRAQSLWGPPASAKRSSAT